MHFRTMTVIKAAPERLFLAVNSASQGRSQESAHWISSASRLRCIPNGICLPCLQLSIIRLNKFQARCQHTAIRAFPSPPLASRRQFLQSGLLAATGSRILDWAALPAVATPIPGYKQYVDRFDGYSFSVPQGWMQVRGVGADVFFRAPTNLDENVIVDVSSPSSSRYKRVEDLGTPDEAANKVVQQYLAEFMSTRLGVRRESNIVAVNSRTAEDGKLYYEVEVNVKSYANNNQLAVMPEDRIVQLEWSRRYLSVLGVENNRLYQLRLQTPEKVLAQEERDLRQIMNSFRVVKIDAA